ncbi:MLX-interacting protein-like isoform X3 [Penaeus monodon]|uniref:MLX-interacting protein-like isoform X3 n=1 Tax=Penaeus monodon TaxID=6687 RepID=UPI0018A788E4|nr:MLX-interacting protein-like isoform X3 [Penaeus monodon]
MTADTSASASTSVSMGRKGEKEVIHSGHFMVSDFEADAQDDEENVLLEIPGDGGIASSGFTLAGPGVEAQDQGVITYHATGMDRASRVETVSIDSSLTKLFKTMSIAYSHKISSPKWNRFKGLKLSWKDKIRLNNVIWRCWHMQFIRRKKMTVCQFALDVDIHNKPEAIVLEGKYWKRQLDAVTAEYKKWRIYYKNKISGKSILDSDASIFDLDGMDFSRGSGMQVSLDDGDLSEFMDFTSVLFSSLISPSQAFAFPNPREIARGTGNSDFIQPGLIQLQPNLDDFMDIVEPLQDPSVIVGKLSPEKEMLAGRGLATVPEEDFLPEVGETPELPTASPPPVSLPLHYNTEAHANTFLESSSPTHAHSPSHKAIAPLPQQHPSSVFPAGQIPLQQQHQQHQQTSIKSPQQQQQQKEPQLVPLPTQSPPASFQASLGIASVPAQAQHLQPQQQSPNSSLQLQQPPTPPQQQLQQLQQPLTPPQQQLQQPLSPQLQSQQCPRSFIRSHSQHDLSTPPQPISLGDSSFVVPSAVPRRRSHSSGGSNSSSGLVGSPSLAPHQVISSVPVTSLPHLLPALNSMTATSLSHVAPTAPPTASVQASGTSLVTAPVIAPSSSPAGSALLAQLLTSGSYSVSCNSQPTNTNQLASIGSTNQLNNLGNNKSCNNVKVSLVIPGVITGNSSNSSCSSSSSSSSSLCSINSVTNIKPSVSTPLLMPPITLSAVTPSTLKTQSFSQLSPWSPCSPQGIIKQSPPHPEPSSPLMMNVPSPPTKAFRPKSDVERVQYKEHRRVCHINAEQKRRSNLKNNFDIMHQLIPSISQNHNAKISKAAMLQKGAEYIQQLKAERQQLSDQAEKFRAQIESLSLEISNAQSLLPATGAPMTHARHSKLKEMFNNYVRERTLANWKFWIFSLITEPLLESYNNSVSINSLDDLCRSSLAWLDQQCSLNVLRPLVSNSMRKLSTTTNVLAEPENLPEEIYRRVTKQEGERYPTSR